MRISKYKQGGATRMTDIERQKVIKAWEAGLTTVEIGKALSRDPSSIATFLKNRGYKLRPQIRTGEAHQYYRGGRFSVSGYSMKVLQAVKKGEIERKTACEECGEEKLYKNGRAGVHAHHDDYNYPLMVRWLCRKCHFEWHRYNQPVPLRRAL